MAYDFPYRQIHLDFHTGPDIPDVGAHFDADVFGDMLAEARVNSITLFAKCHHGHLYYNTKHPARHPGLKTGLDLLGEQLEACRRRSIRAPIYLSVQCDEYAARNYPQWRVVDHEGKLAGGPLQAGWHIMDMSSPYQDYMAQQIDEVLRRFRPVDGLFLDMCWDQPSCSTWALDAMVKEGLDPTLEVHRQRYAHEVSLAYMGRFKKIADQGNRGRPAPVAFNSRPLANLTQEKKFLRHVEIEALPSGGWGYMYFPINVRFVRTFGLPYLGMTARFHKSWADFGGIKPEAALLYECGQMLAHGARCSVGDQLHPRGTLDRAAYELIGKVYRHVEACEPWCHEAKAITQVAVLRESRPDAYMLTPGCDLEGVTRILTELRHQFDFVPPQFDLKRYEAVIVPESISIDAALAAKLSDYVRGGGALLLSGPAALDALGKPALDGLGFSAHGPSPFQTTYVRFDPALAQGVADTDHVMYERGVRLKANRSGKALARVVEPYFDRSWQHFSSHFQTPPDQLSSYAAVVETRMGKGCIMTLAFPLFKAYATHGNLWMRQMAGNCLNRLMPQPLVRCHGPSHVEVTLARQGRRTVVHVLSFAPVRRTPNLDIVEDAWPLVDLPLSIRVDRQPKRAYLAPAQREIPFTFSNGRVDILLSSSRGHVMVVLE